MSKLTIIGAGNVGAACAQQLVNENCADVVLLDVIEGLPQGKALDIMEATPILNRSASIIGTNSYDETANSDVVIVTSGLGRKPGMSREDLLVTNMKIVTEVINNVASYSPDAVIIMVTNPVDVMTYLAIRVSQFPRKRVFGLSGVLDNARLAYFIADELKVSVMNISPCVLGQHGENMVAIPRLTAVNGIPITELLPEETIDRLVKRTVDGGAEIIRLLKSGSAFYAPSTAAARMAKAVIFNKREILICATYLEGEYRIKNTVIGVPVKLGRGGIEQIIELRLTLAEQQKLTNSAEVVRKVTKTLGLG